jgi:hypothetical protein
LGAPGSLFFKITEGARRQSKGAKAPPASMVIPALVVRGCQVVLNFKANNNNNISAS